MAEFLRHDEIAARVGLSSPWKLLDFAEKIDDTHFAGFKNFTVNEAFFVGHFPVHPIVPGVLQVEAIRQLCVCFLNGNAADIRIRQLDKVKFRRQVLPGDQMKVSAEIISRDGDDTVVKAVCSTASGSCSEAMVTFTVDTSRCAINAVPEANEKFARNDAIFMDTDKVMSLMPHRYPFLLIDYISAVEGDKILAVKNVSGNEHYIDSGFFSVPEALLCEISAQAGCACVLSRPENAGKLGFFMAIDKAVFHRRVYPGEQMVLDIDLPPSKSRFGKGSGVIRVGAEAVAEIALMFALVDA